MQWGETMNNFQKALNDFSKYLSNLSFPAEEGEENTIEHPNHYTWRGKECIEIIDALTQGAMGVDAYLLGCAVKYIYRYPMKNGKEDLEKARQCLKMIEERMESDEPSNN